ncbi:hypothetical protein [Tsukamurella sp. PLM1]|uniref:hypothetical protein n=1 Tax=Tsukamurella sp. PLM1 TaxID=2929795 RepID=UPI0020544D6C|nr:hypothetical protein [Tsukamurella sp. PLM1]BDH58740.1 hypothetical protein MTP03_36790 [Tsukamurella sp. PLM1]
MPVLRDENRANRVTDDDRTIELAGVVLRGHLISQAVFEYATGNEPTIADLRRTAGHLARGPLNRTLRRTPVPGARSSAARRPDGPRPPARPAAGAGGDHRVAAGATRADRRGPGRVCISRARRTDGRTLVSVQYPHTAADGGAMYAALLAASRGTTGPRTPDDAAPRPRLAHDLVDAGRQLRRLLRTVREHDGGHPPTPPVERPGRADVLPHTGGPAPLIAAFSTPAAAWRAAAQERSASGNTLLVAFMSDLLLNTARYAGLSTVPTTIPIDVRVDGSRDANNTASATVAVPRDAVGADLAGLHATIKAALVASGNRPGAERRPAPLEVAAHFIPDALVDRLAGPHPMSLLTCSNMGTVAPDFRTLFGPAADRILMLAAPTPVTEERLLRGGGGLAAWLDGAGDTVTLSVVCLDPLCFADGADAQRHIAATAARFGIVPEFWNI